MLLNLETLQYFLDTRFIFVSFSDLKFLLSFRNKSLCRKFFIYSVKSDQLPQWLYQRRKIFEVKPHFLVSAWMGDIFSTSILETKFYY